MLGSFMWLLLGVAIGLGLIVRKFGKMEETNIELKTTVSRLHGSLVVRTQELRALQTKRDLAAMLTDAEKAVLSELGNAFNAFAAMSDNRDDDVREFTDAIHKAQCLVALRVARRADPDVWAPACTKAKT